MSSLILDTQPISDILTHPNADLLEIAVVKGWQCVVQKGQFQVGEVVTYFPPDLLLPKELGDALNVTKYLKNLARSYPDCERFAGRVGVAKLRGVASYGVLATPHSDWLDHADDLAEYLGVEKYSPPEEIKDGDAECQNPFFHKYTDMENLRNFPDAFDEGELVVATEKIHGRNCRLGLCYEDGEMVLMAGSHNVRRRQYDTQGRLSIYWKPLEICPDLGNMLRELHKAYQTNIVVFGELYGPGLQDLTYGQKDLAFRVFDIAVNTSYLGYEALHEWTRRHDIPTVPQSYAGPFYWDQLEEHAKLSSSVSPVTQLREGIVIRPIDETTDRNGRMIYKLINFDYLNRKGGSELH